MRTIADRITACIGYLSAVAPEPKRERIQLAFRQFAGYLRRFQSRYSEALSSEWFILLRADDRFLNDHQSRHVDKTEALHQQAYALLSGFALLLTHAWPDMQGHVPTSSIGKFLDLLRDRFGTPVLAACEVLDRSRDYRNKYVDHPQQQKICDWHSLSNGACVALVYGVPKGAPIEDVPVEGVDPFHEDFKPPCGFEQAFVVPHAAELTDAVHRLTLDVLERIVIGHMRGAPVALADARTLLLRGRLEHRLATQRDIARHCLVRCVESTAKASLRLEAQIEHADTHETDGNCDLAVAEWTSLLPAAVARRSLGHYCRLQRRLATHALNAKRPDDARERLLDVIGRGTNVSVRERAGCLHFLATIEAAVGENLDASEKLTEEAIALLQSDRDEEVAGRLFHHRGYLAHSKGSGEAHVLLMEAICCRELAGDRRGEATTRMYLAGLLNETGQAHLAEAQQRRAERARLFF